jgi:hypothetical protein
MDDMSRNTGPNGTGTGPNGISRSGALPLAVLAVAAIGCLIVVSRAGGRAAATEIVHTIGQGLRRRLREAAELIGELGVRREVPGRAADGDIRIGRHRIRTEDRIAGYGA